MIVKITSKDNSIYKKAVQLQKRKNRDKEGLFLLEGLRPMEEAIKAGIKPEGVFFSEDIAEEEKEKLFNLAGDVKLYEISLKMIKELTCTENPQGIVFLGRIEKKDIGSIGTKDTVLILDRIQDPGNLGTILRTAGAAGIRDIILTKGSVDFYSPKVLRSSMGGIFHLSIYYAEDEGELIALIKDKGYLLVCADAKADKEYYKENFQGKVALVIGNENQGPNEKFLAEADSHISIPMPGGIESLNASVAAGILIYEILRQKG